MPAFRKATGNADDRARPDAVGRPDRQGQGRPRQPADRRDAARSGPGPRRHRARTWSSPIPVATSKHYKDLIPEAQEPMGPATFFQVVGPDLQPREGQDAADLLGRPVEAGIQGPRRHHQPELDARHRLPGGDRARCTAARRATSSRASRRIEQLKPNLAAVAANPGALAALFQQGQIDICARQLQRHPDPEGARRAGGVRGAEGRRHRLQDHASTSSRTRPTRNSPSS